MYIFSIWDLKYLRVYFIDSLINYFLTIVDIVSEYSTKHMSNGFHNKNTANGSPNNINLYQSRSYSDGSDRDDQEDDESQSYYNENDEDQSVPRITVQNKCYRLDKLNPCLITQMNDAEKEFYIQVCRQLYTEIYEIWTWRQHVCLFVEQLYIFYQ